ncbi:MAG: ATP-dependent helicase, partial [Desulfobacterales bacterium]
IAQFKQTILDTLATNDLGFFHGLMDQFRQEHDVPALDIAAALAKMAQGEAPMLMPEKAPERQTPKPKKFFPKKGDVKKPAKSGKPNPQKAGNRKNSPRPAGKKKAKTAITAKR